MQRRTHSPSLAPLALLALLALTACGGGGNDPSEPEAEGEDQPAVWDQFDWDDREWS